MKRSLFALFAAVTLLLAAPVMAQQEEPVQDPELEAYESRTNPDADSITGDSGLTITGTVVEWNDEQLTLRTTTGVQHIQIVPNTDRPVELTAGENVSVDYTRTTQGVMIASKIRTQGTVTGAETDVATTELQTDDTMGDADLQAEADLDTSLDTDTTMDEDFDADASLNADADFESDLDADLDTQADLDTTMDDEDSLPATGSELPLVALLGLLSVAAAVGVRSYLR